MIFNFSTWYQSEESKMCYTKHASQNSTAENASEDAYDLLIPEHERVEIENAMRITNAIFNATFTEMFVEPANNEEQNSYSFPQDIIEESEIQTILRGEY